LPAEKEPRRLGPKGFSAPAARRWAGAGHETPAMLGWPWTGHGHPGRFFPPKLGERGAVSALEKKCPINPPNCGHMRCP